MIKTEEDIGYEKLKSLIFNNELPKGKFLSQRSLATKLNTAVATLRCILRRLENDGLIENVPKWGVRIPFETEKDIIDRYYIREILEVGAIIQILRNKTKDDYDRLMEAAEACDSLKDEDTNKSVLFANHHMTFHSLLGELSGNPLLHKMMNQVIIKSFMIYNAQRGWARGIDRDSHRKLVIDLFKADSQEKIESIMRAHVKRGLQDEIEVLHFNQQ